MLPVEVVHEFVNAINSRNPENICRWMTEDHVFIDSLGKKMSGKEKMQAAWEGYFRMVPDYSIEIDETFVGGDSAVMVGIAQGTYAAGGELRPENHWQTQAAWRVQVRGPLVAEWRIYADNEPIRQIMARTAA